MNYKLRITIVLALMVIIPESVFLYMLESGRSEKLISLLSLHLAICGALLVPLGKIIGHLVIGREISELFDFCSRIKQGQYGGSFPLPNEKEDEEDIVKLKRLLNWMTHTLFVKEQQRLQQLGEKEKLSVHYRKLSLQDGLTRLYNRRYFNEEFPRLVKRALHARTQLILMMIDVDNFKKINDSYGHQEGDRLLILLAEILKGSCRSEGDISFRYGGDEFGIIIPGISAQDGGMIAARILDQYREIAPETTSLSIGVSSLRHGVFPEDKAVSELIKAADDNVYLAKKSGRAAVCVEGKLLHAESSALIAA